MQIDTEAGPEELPAYCRGILNPALKAITFCYVRPADQKTHASCETLNEPPLKSTERRHLLAEMILVLADAAVPSSHRLVLTHHNVLCDLVEQSVVR
jgi:hypothetical protein